MTLLSESNIQDLDDLKQRVINPYVYGHSFTFCGIDLVLASVHQFWVYESEIRIGEGVCEFDGNEGVKELSREATESIKL